MAEKILMLALSPTMQSGKITKWHKKEGDTVANGQLLCDIETDKATMEYESPTDGTILKILVEEGASANIGQTIAIAGKKGENIEDIVKKQPEIKSEKAGAVSKPDTLGDKKQADVSSTEKESHHKASPLARKMAQEARISPAMIQGTGPNGRIIKRDIERYLQEQRNTPLKERQSSPIDVACIAVQNEKIPLSQKRKIIAQRLAQSKFTAPHYYLKVSVNMKAVLTERKKLNQSLAKKLSLNAFLIKFCAEALKRNPKVHCTWREDAIEQFSQCDIGLAVAQNDGLITPVVRNCGSKGILQIENELSPLIEKALGNKLLPEEFQNATFTISNLGSYGIEEFTAIINPPGSAILAVGEIKKEAIVSEEDKIVIEPIAKMTLSCDHRVIDGAVGAAFLRDLKQMLENPILALL